MCDVSPFFHKNTFCMQNIYRIFDLVDTIDIIIIIIIEQDSSDFFICTEQVCKG